MSIAAIGLLGFYVYSSAKDRNAGGSPTGGTNMAQQEHASRSSRRAGRQ